MPGGRAAGLLSALPGESAHAYTSSMEAPENVDVQSTCGPAVGLHLLPEDDAIAEAEVFKALGDPTRLRLLHHIAEAQDGTVCSCHLPGALGISQPTMSHHLKKLTDAGLITREQRGRWAHYTVNTETLERARVALRPRESLRAS